MTQSRGTSQTAQSSTRYFDISFTSGGVTTSTGDTDPGRSGLSESPCSLACPRHALLGCLVLGSNPLLHAYHFQIHLENKSCCPTPTPASSPPIAQCLNVLCSGTVAFDLPAAIDLPLAIDAPPAADVPLAVDIAAIDTSKAEAGR